MPQISILSGVTADSDGDWRTALPVNYIPVPKDTGVSKGFLREAPGLTLFATGAGFDRGGINWNGVCYRVSGTSLQRVNADGTVTTIGAISGSGPVRMDYGPTYLAIVGDQKSWLYDGATLTQITDPDLGTVVDIAWIDGYYMYTDGTHLVQTELANPFSIDPLKYGSSEADPDPIKGVLKLRSELYVLNRYTIEVFNNIGGTGFAFQRVPGGQIAKGCCGTHAKARYVDTFAWLGSGRNEPASIYVALNGSATKIASKEVEVRLAGYSEDQLAAAELESRAYGLHEHLLVHLPNETMVYDAAASAAIGEPVWFFLSSAVVGPSAYRGRHFVWCYGKWICGDTTGPNVGYMDETVNTQYGGVAGAQFDTMYLYNAGKGAIVWSLELVGTTGRASGAADPTVFHSYTLDGVNWSQERTARMGSVGQTTQRVVFRECGGMQNIRGDRFRKANATPVSWSRLEAELEALYA